MKLAERVKRGEAAGLDEKAVREKWEIGTLQELRGDVVSESVDDFLEKFTVEERAWIEAKIERLRGIPKSVRFRKQAIVLLSQVCARAYHEGLKTGHRKESARIHTKRP
jgi:hypothetical protein